MIDLRKITEALEGIDLKEGHISTKSAVVISKDRYRDLLKSEGFLESLESAGVDNWGGFDFAVELERDREQLNEKKAIKKAIKKTK